MASSAPTVYATLMDEAIAGAEQFRERFVQSSEIAELVAPALQESFRSAIRYGFRQAYVAGLTHGYQQAAQAFDNRPQLTDALPEEGVRGAQETPRGGP
jgi:flagellar biosynthesis/type III secretory pathway protein FliH